jgi:hypothetical protein
VALAALVLWTPVRAEEAKKTSDPPRKACWQVPYRLTDTKHVLVRAKINGKGPYHFILDTGAPALFVATTVCKKLQVEPDAKGWGIFDRFEIEGGVVLEKVRGRVEDPFQLEGMNHLGLAGAELHGVIGYNVLAGFRLEIDFTRDKMGWTRLDFQPPAPLGLEGKSAAGGLEAMGAIMKLLSALIGKQGTFETKERGFLGIELADTDNGVKVEKVLAGGPAAQAGVQAGDRISHFQGKPVRTVAELLQLATRHAAGETVKLALERRNGTQEIEVQTGKGL